MKLYALELRDTGKQLDEERNVAMNARGFEGYKMRSNFFRSLRQHEIKCMKCEKEFQKLEQVTDYANRVEPMVYTGLLILGILCSILSIFFIGEALGAIIRGDDKPDGIIGEDSEFGTGAWQSLMSARRCLGFLLAS